MYGVLRERPRVGGEGGLTGRLELEQHPVDGESLRPGRLVQRCERLRRARRQCDAAGAVGVVRVQRADERDLLDPAEDR